jgi:hypothetical protein
MDPATIAMISAIMGGILRLALTAKQLSDNPGDQELRDRLLQEQHAALQPILADLQTAAAAAQSRLDRLAAGETKEQVYG